MKALTLYQPGATLVAIGAKQIETRSWSTKYRGELAIHAGKHFPLTSIHNCYRPHFLEALKEHGFDRASSLPLGCVVATCELDDVVRIVRGVRTPLGSEWYFGDYTLGRYMWFLKNIKMLPEPIPARGNMGLWEWQQ